MLSSIEVIFQLFVISTWDKTKRILSKSLKRNYTMFSSSEVNQQMLFLRVTCCLVFCFITISFELTCFGDAAEKSCKTLRKLFWPSVEFYCRLHHCSAKLSLIFTKFLPTIRLIHTKLHRHDYIVCKVKLFSLWNWKKNEKMLDACKLGNYIEKSINTHVACCHQPSLFKWLFPPCLVIACIHMGKTHPCTKFCCEYHTIKFKIKDFFPKKPKTNLKIYWGFLF